MKKYKILHFQGMGSFNWFKLYAWNPLKRAMAVFHLDKLIKKIKEHGFADNSAVMWLSSGKACHRNLNKKTPWKCRKKNGRLVFDFSKPNKKFYKLWKLWLKRHKKHHLKFIPILMMREDYCWYPFSNNVNGIKGVYSPGALEVILDYMERSIKIYIEVFGKPPTITPWNEPAHYGNGKLYHQIMYNHEAVWERVLKPLGGKLKNMYPDITMCEGAAGELIEPHKCSKPGDCDRGGWHGKPGQERNKDGITCIKHGFTTLSDFNEKLSNGFTRLENMTRSGNSQRMYTEDGGGATNDGEYEAGVFEIRLGSARQQYKMMLELIRVWKEHGFFARFGTFPHEALFCKKKIVDDEEVIDLLIPDYRPRNINWGRIKNGVLKACKEKL